MNIDDYNIFYTDDDTDDLQFFKDAALEVDSGVQVITQNNGDDLIALLNNPPPKPTLLFLDLNMPVKNGYEVLREIREADRTKNIPVIVFSTSDDKEAITTTKKLGANLYITKPSSYTHLKKIIRHSLTIDWQNFCPSGEDFIYRVN